MRTTTEIGNAMCCAYCRTRNVWDRVRYLDAHGELTTYPARVTCVESRVCLACQQPQPLGPSREDGEHAASVAIEVRAARVALCPSLMNLSERVGWTIAENPHGAANDLGLVNGGEQAGYLACRITQHGDDK